ncbi:hydroxyacylglutathione hydrolase [Aliidiomarina shirensis]|uniref:Hydroxyacylglutathione hydrolase n=1 Tax=Aliidiomarina shirensis TaxID=1048642 RepID=A0A432WWH3_9GAMM|nr:hydroxyacylglutathione hydrolase [Aliidiomarina shirensis]RUO38101.1 hydroxyacylglutathione hydrolase [Aliidiomarina shirensis]
MRIAPISAFNDNYIWSISTEKATGTEPMPCVIVDPGDAVPVFEWLAAHNYTIAAILITHHHYDHTGGVNDLVEHFQCPVYGPYSNKTDVITHPLHEGEQVSLLADKLVLEVIQCPGHTLDHIAFYAAPYLFCGDTVFAAGCGRMFEGEPKQYLESLDKLAALPADTQIFCAHEYTIANLQFAAAVEPNNQAIVQRLQEAKALRANHQPTIPTELAREHATNPFLRTHLPSVQHAAEAHIDKPLTTRDEVFACIREWKNNF